MTKALATNDTLAFALAAENIQHLWCRWLIGILRLGGADQFVVSPGYRCSPLLYALNQGGGGAAVYSQRDERAAGYLALGLAKAGHERLPVLICTSGTAMANYYPAVLEAYSDRIPLVILTADRPFELHDCGANQTIRQSGLFGAFCCHALDLPEPSEGVGANVLWHRVQGALSAAREQRRPVHINLPLREPLEPVPAAISPAYLDGLRACQRLMTAEAEPVAKTRPALGEHTDFATTLGSLDKEWPSHDSHWLIVIGGLDSQRSSARDDALVAWLERCTAPIYCDVTSSLKARLSEHPMLIKDPEDPATLDVLNKVAQSPATGVIHIGDRITSGPFQRLVNAVSGPYLRLSPSPDAFDPGSRVTHTFTADIAASLAAAPPVTAATQLAPSPVTASANLTRLDAVQLILKAVAESPQTKDDVLYLGNSSVIRAFNRADWQPLAGRNVTVAANRGVSGIEGLISSAKGLHLGSGKRVILVLGDISFLYDLSALLDPYFTEQVKIILVNDQKGSIFSQLPGRHHDGFINELMTTPHSMAFTELLSGFPLTCHQARSPAELSAALKVSLSSANPDLVEILLEAP